MKLLAEKAVAGIDNYALNRRLARQHAHDVRLHGRARTLS